MSVALQCKVCTTATATATHKTYCACRRQLSSVCPFVGSFTRSLVRSTLTIRWFVRWFACCSLAGCELPIASAARSVQQSGDCVCVRAAPATLCAAAATSCFAPNCAPSFPFLSLAFRMLAVCSLQLHSLLLAFALLRVVDSRLTAQEARAAVELALCVPPSLLLLLQLQPRLAVSPSPSVMFGCDCQQRWANNLRLVQSIVLAAALTAPPPALQLCPRQALRCLPVLRALACVRRVFFKLAECAQQASL